MSEDLYDDPRGIVHSNQIVQTADNIERLDEAIDKLSIEIGMLREKARNCHERALRLAEVARRGRDGV